MNFISQKTLRVWRMAGAIINLICMKIAIGRLSAKWEYGKFLKAKLTDPIAGLVSTNKIFSSPLNSFA